MGMFDNPEPFRDHFREGQVFSLEDAKMGPTIQTDYGEGQPVLLKIEGKWFSIFGAGLTSQVERMEKGDLPARVYLGSAQTRSGRAVKLIIPEGQQADGTAIPVTEADF